MSSIEDGCCEEEFPIGVRVVELELPEDEGSGLGCRLTRTLWDPYPWVRDVVTGAAAHEAGLRAGDCVMRADGRDLLGMPVSQVAGLIRGDGNSRGVSLLVWNCGVDPDDDPELLWSCGGGVRGERARRALGGCVRALACVVCGCTASQPRVCARSHLYCRACWSRLQRCALCRETLPPADSPHARNLVAEQVFEAIAKEYEIKDAPKKTTSSSASASPNLSPSPFRRQHQIQSKNRIAQFHEKYKQNYASDPNLHRTMQESRNPHKITRNITSNTENKSINYQCHNLSDSSVKIQINDSDVPNSSSDGLKNSSCNNRSYGSLRATCSLLDLQYTQVDGCALSRSLNNLTKNRTSGVETGSLKDLKQDGQNQCDSRLLVLPAPQVYILSCQHEH